MLEPVMLSWESKVFNSHFLTLRTGSMNILVIALPNCALHAGRRLVRPRGIKFGGMQDMFDHVWLVLIRWALDIEHTQTQIQIQTHTTRSTPHMTRRQIRHHHTLITA